MLAEGDTAPSFTLPGTDGTGIEEYALASFADADGIVVAFYVFDFHPSCTEELCSMRDLGWFDLMEGTEVLAVSTDSAYSHRAFAREHDIDFPLLSDNDGSVSEAYGVLHDELAGHSRVSGRSVFVLDGDRRVRYAWAAPEPGTLPDWDAVKRAVERL